MGFEPYEAKKTIGIIGLFGYARLIPRMVPVPLLKVGASTPGFCNRLTQGLRAWKTKILVAVDWSDAERYAILHDGQGGAIIGDRFWVVVWRWIWDNGLRMKVKLTTRILVIFGSLMILADLANFFPEKAGAYAVAGAILVAAGILVRADN